MRALRFDGEAPRLVTNHPRPEVGRGEALIRTRKAAVSAIDLELCRGLFGFTGTLGHEFVGVVESINGDEGPDVLGYSRGSEFPHESTANQSYSEEQFEAYRTLGEHIGLAAAAQLRDAEARPGSELPSWWARLGVSEHRPEGTGS